MTTSCCSQFPEVLMEHSDTTLLRTSNGHDSATIGTLDFSEPSLLGKSMDTETHPAVEETQYYKQLSSKDVSLMSNIAFSKQRTVSQNRATLIIRMFVKELQRLAQNLDVIPTLNTFGMNSDGHCEPATLADRPMCRICHDGGGQEELLSPCECAGTLGTIHRSCLEHWLSASSTSFCELCHFQFSVQRKARPLLEWLRNPGLRQEKRTLFGDMVCFLLITPLATISGWLCLRGAVDHLQFSSRLEAVGLIALTVALFTIYLFWTLVSLRYHCRLYNEWRQTNQRVVLLLPKSHSESIGNASVMGLLNAKRPSKETIV